MGSFINFLKIFTKRLIIAVILVGLLNITTLGIQAFWFNDYWTRDNTHGPILTWSDIPGESYLNTSTSITISWETQDPVIGVVKYGETPDLGLKITEDSPTKFHSIVLTGLAPETTYYYKVLTPDGAYKDISVLHSFVTPPVKDADSQVHFAIYGDTRDQINGLQAVANGMYAVHLKDPYNFIVHVGDLVGQGGKRALWNQFFARVGTLHAEAPIVPVIGNHEFYGEDDPNFIDSDFPDDNASYAEHYLKYFALPGNEKYYSLNFGNVHYILLDSNEPGGTFYRDTDVDKNAQAQWLYNDLLMHNTTYDWIFVTFHHPFRNDILYNITTPSGPRSLTISQIFHEGGVDGIFIGHYHTYERVWHTDGGTTVPYVITGGGGADLDGSLYWDGKALVSYAYKFEFMDFHVKGGDIRVNVYDIDGNIIDSFGATNYTWEVDG